RPQGRAREARGPGARRRRRAHAGGRQRVDHRRGAAAPEAGMSERRHHDDRRQRGLRIVPMELPAPLEEAPFLRPNRRTRVRRAPWGAEATVARTLPDTLRVEIRERAPLALAELDRLYLMDGDGSLIDLYGPRTAGFDLPIVRGLAGTTGDARRERAQRAGALLQDLGELAREVSELQVEPSGDLRLVLRGAGEVVHGPAALARPVPDV